MRRRDLVAASLLSLPLTPRLLRAASTPVVVELFTSQGCSSCPPADALLGELTRHAGIIGLGWHVDYWNSLGWSDPFARRDWTERQRGYAKHLAGEVYTPAMVVNGAAMMVGSDRTAVRQAIEQAPPLTVPVSLRRSATGTEAEIGATPSPATALFVTYEREQSTQVGAGENQGRRLTEYRLVRDTLALDLLSPKLALPRVSATQGVVLLVQDQKWRVIGAADLPPVESS